uniref:Biotin carboxylase n=1 Tax=Leptospirillum ferrodiazotrophum TaxID=412449 RepID=C6I0K1_9BACT|nr:MAG: acetyl-CoA carboxylase, biotin carboxylase [Leptospirillum ferrodiazotrophum]
MASSSKRSFKKVLVANRGEIAVRVIRACRDLGLSTVAIYSTADRNALHVQMADEAVCVGPPEGHASYRNIPNIISAAEISQAEAIHPGYGFLSENAHFAEICHAAGITFIGPSPETISLMGDKARAKALMREAGVPVVPGSIGTIATESEGLDVASEIGYPLIIKASGGGGGRGMRIVTSPEEFSNAFQTAQTEALQAFGNKEVYIERFFVNPRHVEIQVLGDSDGTIYTLGERDCSIQRRHQKLLEEAPSPFITAALRSAMSQAAIAASKAADYVNAGTVEFLVDPEERFFFIEMNTRIQVEHPVSESIFRYDLVKAQLLVALGEPIASPPAKPEGHAIECRINAEDPWTFVPSPGTITRLLLPGGPGIRVDTAAYQGAVIPPHYDSLVAKVIATGKNRDEAIARMIRALREMTVEGIKTTIPFHLEVLADPTFRSGRYSTSFVEHFMERREALPKNPSKDPEAED